MKIRHALVLLIFVYAGGHEILSAELSSEPSKEIQTFFPGSENNSLSELLKNPQSQPLEIETKLLEAFRKRGDDARHEAYQNISLMPPMSKYALTNALQKVAITCNEVNSITSQLIEDQFHLVRRNVVALVKYHRCIELAPLLRQAFEKENRDEVRRTFIDAMGSVGNPTDVPMLQSIQDDDSAPMIHRLTAAQSLLNLKGPADLSVIYNALSEKDANVVGQAIVALSYAGKSAIKKLRPFLKVNDLHQYNKADRLSLLARGSILEIEVRADSEPREKLFKFLESEHELERSRAATLLCTEFYDSAVQSRLTIIANKRGHPSRTEVAQVLYETGRIGREEFEAIVRDHVEKNFR